MASGKLLFLCGLQLRSIDIFPMGSCGIQWNEILKCCWNCKELYAKSYLVWYEPLFNTWGCAIVIFLVTPCLERNGHTLSPVICWAVLGAGLTTFWFFSILVNSCQEVIAREGISIAKSWEEMKKWDIYIGKEKSSESQSMCLHISYGWWVGRSMCVSPKEKKKTMIKKVMQEQSEIWWIQNN